MARVPRLNEVPAPAAQAELDRQLAAHGRLTNMKRTDRLTTLFAHAVSTETDCLICSTFFRRILIDAGENPDDLKLDAKESAVVAFGLALARDNARVPEPVYRRVADFLDPGQMVAREG
jgi:hypothetical protein